MIDLIFTLVVWSFCGYIISACIIETCKDEEIRRGEMKQIEGFEYLNPTWIYKNFRVNYLGMTLLTILHNALCPLGAAYYWLIYVCTVGRK